MASVGRLRAITLLAEADAKSRPEADAQARTEMETNIRAEAEAKSRTEAEATVRADVARAEPPAKADRANSASSETSAKHQRGPQDHHAAWNEMQR
ncbi:hypothetical protein [Methylobacterium radiodurans]|uniref:hypothetical protein n=1 Tax=Methylobacterium radiodurans TaxID=2202828 RepID=UPI0013A52C56|nr:hypothetical protein [Methylobacterium radiodurans]